MKDSVKNMITKSPKKPFRTRLSYAYPKYHLFSSIPAAKDSKVKAIVVTGKGNAFCGGAAVDEFAKPGAVSCYLSF